MGERGGGVCRGEVAARAADASDEAEEVAWEGEVQKLYRVIGYLAGREHVLMVADVPEVCLLLPTPPTATRRFRRCSTLVLVVHTSSLLSCPPSAHLPIIVTINFQHCKPTLSCDLLAFRTVRFLAAHGLAYSGLSLPALHEPFWLESGTAHPQ